MGMYSGGSAYFKDMEQLMYNENLPVLQETEFGWRLVCACSLKNNGEIQDWVDWLSTIAVGGFVRWRYEEMETAHVRCFGNIA